MSWLEETSLRLSGGRLEVCDAGHTHHSRRTVDTVQGTLEIFDADKYAHTVGYCTGDDAVSRSLVARGEWEPHVWRALEDLGVLDEPADLEVVLDFGSHVGWYSRLAATAGFHVLAIDGELEHLDMTAANAARAAERADRDLVLCRSWIDGDTREIDRPVDGTSVRLVKADLESSERHVIRILSRLLEGDTIVDWLLLEISPIFRRDYHETVLVPLLDAGYRTAYRCHRGVRLWDWRLDFPQEEILFTREP